MRKHPFLYLVLLFSINVSSVYSQTASQILHTIFNNEWQMRLEHSPLLATRMGKIQSNHLLDDVSEKSYLDFSALSQGYLDRLFKINIDNLTLDDQINYQIFKSQLEHRISEIAFKTYQMPFTSDSGFHSQIMQLHQQIPLKNLKDHQNYLQRLKAIPKYFDQHIENMEQGLKRNFSMPQIVMQGFSQVIETAYVQDYAKSPFWQPFNSLPSTIKPIEQQKLKAQAKAIIKLQVLPAFKKLHHFFDDQYIPKSKKSLAASDFPNGKAYYKSQIKHYTTLNLSPEAIHQLGLKEVSRIRAEMEKIISDLKFKGSFQDFLTFLRTSKQFYANTPLELLKEASFIAKKMDGKLPQLFTKLPRQPYTVEPVPDSIAPKYTTGRYLSAPLDSERSGTYWVNTYALDKRPLYVLEALTLHEAVPGHHLQGALNQELSNLPNFRRYSYISAFGEGWGLYSERLGLEVGFYQDAYSNFGRLTYEMWRAARLVIDTGIHSKGWSREKAILLLKENSALSTHNIQTEVDRYISWPAQALSYKLGEIKIRDLRSKAEARLKEHFDLRLFHDEILKNGSIPLDVLERQIERFIERQVEKINK